MSKPSVEQLAAACSDVDEKLVRQHVDRLDDQYFQRFDTEQVGEHLRMLDGLSKDEPVRLRITKLPGGMADITVAALDYPALFSLIAGVLAGTGYSIESGDVFTYDRAPDGSTTRPSAGVDNGNGGRPSPVSRYGPAAVRGAGKSTWRRKQLGQRIRKIDPTSLRRVIDHFVGRYPQDLDFTEWSTRLGERMSESIGALAAGDADVAKHRVNELVTSSLAEADVSYEALLWPIELEIDNTHENVTRITVVAEDTPAFLYTLVTALSLRNLSIERVRIGTADHRIEDEIDVVDAAGNAVRDAAVLEKIKLSVLLTKQFTYFLSRAPDPFSALTRFETLTEDILASKDNAAWLDLLSNPRAMLDLARLLGASDYLWQDFVRQHYGELLRLLKPQAVGRRICPPSETIPGELADAIDTAESYEAKVDALNAFKDRAIFLIDLDHMLTPGSDFRVFSHRLTDLAEAVVDAAAKLAWKKVTCEHGVPRDGDGEPVAWAVMGLGKAGGRALGYASDIELLFVYAGEPGGQTDGVKPIANNVLFERFVQEFTQVIRAKREGIFEIDLRLRPFGKDGPLACTLDNFDRYFRADATDRQSHPMERLALVRMRRFAGDRALGEHVEQLRDRHVYDPGEIELEALRELRRKAYREKATGGTFNAKRGCGGLIDLEVAVQTLQVMHAANHAAVRTPFIHEALTALAETGVIDDDEHEAVVSAYEFLRQLINGLRMERGSAIDLFMPTRDTQEYLHLARRVEYEHTHGLDVGEQLQIDLQHATATVRAFVERHFSREALPDPDIANIADVVLSDDVGATWRNEVLSGIGLKDLRAADSLLRGMAGAGGRRRVFARLALLAVHLMPAADAVDRDHLLRRWTRWVSRLSDPQQQFAAQLDAPITLRILLGLLGGSDAAASVLIRVPELLIWATRPERILRPQQLKALDDALRDAAKDHTVGN